MRAPRLGRHVAERQPLQQQQQPDYFTLELGPHSGPTWGATAPVIISKDLALGADFVFEQYREGVADRAAENERRRSSKGGKRGNRDGALEGGELRHSADGGCVPAPHPVDDVLRELGLGEFAADRGGANAADFGFGKSSAEDGREEEGVRFLRLLKQAASPQAMLHGSQYLQLIAMVRAHPFHEDKALSAQALCLMRELERMHPAAASLIECKQRQHQRQSGPSQAKTEEEEELNAKKKKKPRTSLSGKKAKSSGAASTPTAAAASVPPCASSSLAVLVDPRPWTLARIYPGMTALPAAQGAEDAGVMGKDALSARASAAAARAAANAAAGAGDGAGSGNPLLLLEGVTLTAFGGLAKLAAALERAACAPRRAGKRNGGSGGRSGSGKSSPARMRVDLDRVVAVAVPEGGGGAPSSGVSALSQSADLVPAGGERRSNRRQSMPAAFGGGRGAGGGGWADGGGGNARLALDLNASASENLAPLRGPAAAAALADDSGDALLARLVASQLSLDAASRLRAFEGALLGEEGGEEEGEEESFDINNAGGGGALAQAERSAAALDLLRRASAARLAWAPALTSSAAQVASGGGVRALVRSLSRAVAFPAEADAADDEEDEEEGDEDDGEENEETQGAVAEPPLYSPSSSSSAHIPPTPPPVDARTASASAAALLRTLLALSGASEAFSPVSASASAAAASAAFRGRRASVDAALRSSAFGSGGSSASPPVVTSARGLHALLCALPARDRRRLLAFEVARRLAERPGTFHRELSAAAALAEAPWSAAEAANAAAVAAALAAPPPEGKGKRETEAEAEALPPSCSSSSVLLPLSAAAFADAPSAPALEALADDASGAKKGSGGLLVARGDVDGLAAVVAGLASGAAGVILEEKRRRRQWRGKRKKKSARKEEGGGGKGSKGSSSSPLAPLSRRLLTDEDAVLPSLSLSVAPLRVDDPDVADGGKRVAAAAAAAAAAVAKLAASGAGSCGGGGSRGSLSPWALAAMAAACAAVRRAAAAAS